MSSPALSLGYCPHPMRFVSSRSSDPKAEHQQMSEPCHPDQPLIYNLVRSPEQPLPMTSRLGCCSVLLKSTPANFRLVHKFSVFGLCLQQPLSTLQVEAFYNLWVHLFSQSGVPPPRGISLRCEGGKSGHPLLYARSVPSWICCISTGKLSLQPASPRIHLIRG